MKTIEQLKKLILKPQDNSLNEQLAALSSWDYGSIYRGSDIYTSGTWTPHTYTVGYDWSYQDSKTIIVDTSVSTKHIATHVWTEE